MTDEIIGNVRMNYSCYSGQELYSDGEVEKELLNIVKKYPRSEYNKIIAQVLLNAEDIKTEEKKENLSETLDTLLKMGIIPIVNTSSIIRCTESKAEEPLFEDDDMLAVIIAAISTPVSVAIGTAAAKDKPPLIGALTAATPNIPVIPISANLLTLAI